MKIDLFEVKEKVNCALCNCSQHQTLFNIHKFKWVKCFNCQMVYVEPQLTNSSISQIYKILYSNKSKSLKKSTQPQHFRILNKLQNPLSPNNKLLDVGCFKGDFLNVAKNNKWKVYGTEISTEAINYALENYKIKIDQGTVIDIDYSFSFFDAIVINDVIEHLPNPKECLEKISKIIKKGGILYIGTPNFNSLSRYFFGKYWGAVIFPWHLQYFTVKTLSKLLKKYNFEIKEVSTKNILLNLTDPYIKLKKIYNNNKIKERTFLNRVANYGLNKIFNILFYILDKLNIFVGSQIELYAIKK